ncbi:hypothetical protein GYH30_004458 [Glycine max]|nr:hypothetical protein GYH30_004458 [Glycine max]
MASASQSFVSQSFPNFIAEKLDDANYLQDDHIADLVNPEYEAWDVWDQTLLVWLQFTLSKSVLSCVLGLNRSYRVWKKIHEYFSLHKKSRACQLRTAMRAVSLEGKSIDEYLCKIKGYVNELTGVGVPVHHEYVDMILEGLSFDYTLMISVIESKKHTLSIAEIETLLYGHETHIVCYNKETQALSSPFLNYTQGYSHPNSYKSGDSGGSRGAYGRGSGGRGGFLDRGAGRSGGAFAEVEPYESLTFFDPTTLPPIPYSSNSAKTSNTWVSPNSKPAVPASNQPMLCLPIPPLMEMVILVPPGYQTLVLASM